MRLTPDITYRNVRSGPWLQAEIRRRVATLTTFYPEILSCRVLVEVPHRQLAFRHAFAAAKRQLQDFARRRRRAVKAHVNARSVPAA
jgi:hypothetical protein